MSGSVVGVGVTDVFVSAGVVVVLVSVVIGVETTDILASSEDGEVTDVLVSVVTDVVGVLVSSLDVEVVDVLISAGTADVLLGCVLSLFDVGDSPPHPVNSITKTSVSTICVFFIVIFTFSHK
jgi:hypothetical protein